MIIEEAEFHEHNMGKLVKGAVVPRPIAWVSSLNTEGVRNLAPFSFFTVASLEPVIFCISISPGGDAEIPGDKDTLANIRATGEFVINIVSEDFTREMYLSSKQYETLTDEFIESTVDAAESRMVSPPRVAGVPVSMECLLHRIIPAGKNHLVLGRMVCYHIRDDVYMEVDKVNPGALKPIGRMAGDYAFIREFFSLPNPDL